MALSGDAAKTIGPLSPQRTAFARAGGPVFAIILILTSAFTLALFDLRAAKIFALPETAAEAGAEDLVAFFRASAMAASGRAADAYEAGAFREGLDDRHKGMLWLNPPHALLLIAPLDGASYAAAKLALIVLTGLSLAMIARLSQAPVLLAAALIVSPAAFASLLVMQTGPLIALGLLTAFHLAGTRPIFAGLILALMTVKPQYGLMAPVFLAALGHWRAVGAATVFTAILVAGSVALFGIAPWTAFLDSMTGGAMSAHAGNLHRDMLSAASTLGKLGAGPGLNGVAQAGVILIAAVAVFLAARRWPRDASVGFALIASAASSPSLWVYDWPLVAAGLLMLARASATAGAPWTPATQLAAGLLWLGPLYSLGLATMAGSLIAPALLALTLVAAWLWADGIRALPERPSAAPAFLRRPYAFLARCRRQRYPARPI